MPRNVRNFWIEADIDGYKNTLKGGAQARDGGMDIEVLYREHGSIAEETINIDCTSDGEENVIKIKVGGKVVFERRVLR